MDLIKGFKIMGLCVYLSKEKTLVIGDVHMGYEEALNKQGVLIPRVQFKETMHEIKQIFSKIKPKKVVLLGDLKHEFGSISNQEWNDTLNFLDFLLSKSDVILIKGNHDTILQPIATKSKIQISNHYRIGSVLFCHGDKIIRKELNNEIKTIIIGHEHPAIGIRDGARVEKYKCFLVGNYNNYNLIVLPSFNFIVEGTDILQEKTISPFIKKLDEFEVYVATKKPYYFGKIKEFQSILDGRN